MVALAALALAALALGAVPSGCSLQAEGERCDRNAGDDDCESGLVCTSPEQLDRTDLGSDVCGP
ncbi:MAG: hypothetical protein HY744_20580, partial [Deltaproteobacteria bacterium]|nr:hypothetical protein [Deltaproteobacteria bacterium]